ncbi:membrane-spanning 4-domains subfamily A member 8-like isoform X2 [Neoarius graeffei]|uniref:membrane-spanning 4-domains subfamily A member 8-like isoform X2 n=1 Tax=Neoarius graeffei TaxID=443677 RepID=UPI00298C0BCB|nr:membrane-spanning 4-domains subfamily A member 8-like isoform X2 [Neoarius graeffei]
MPLRGDEAESHTVQLKSGQNPQMAAVGQPLPPGSNMTNTSLLPIHRFLAGQPKALGVVQIMIGLVTLLFGIVLLCDYAPVSVISGNVFWASIAYIATGSLSVAAENKLHPCMVRASLGMNVVSAVFSAVGIAVLITDLFLMYYCNYSYYDYCYMFQLRSKAISGVLLVFAILQFIISIFISVFACRSEPMMPIAAYSNQAATVNSQVPVTFVNQAVNPNPQSVLYIPQAQMNMNHPISQNIMKMNLHSSSEQSEPQDTV